MDKQFVVGGKVFESGTHVMGIVNITPDSFFAPSRVSAAACVDTAKRMLDEGAEILDIGGQSTRPNGKGVSAIEEMSRVLPAIEAIKAQCPGAIVSVDTFYPEVAQAAIECGADMINDVSGLQFEDLVGVIASTGVSVCVMHTRRNSTQPSLFLDKFLGLEQCCKKLLAAGVAKNRILLDGGIGFNKSADEDWQLLDGYASLMADFADYHFLLGTSRKSMFGKDPSKNLSATLESTLKAKKMGVLFVRVHDVADNVRVLREL